MIRKLGRLAKADADMLPVRLAAAAVLEAAPGPIQLPETAYSWGDGAGYCDSIQLSHCPSATLLSVHMLIT